MGRAPTRRLTLLTDFGTRDGYVGAMKGVLATTLPTLPVDDIAHDLPAGDVQAARDALARYWRRYPPGTVHVVVVDPGVGTARRALACEADGRFLIAPDNGVLTRPLEEAEGWRAVEIRNVRPPEGITSSATFHGRDVFAPAAAWLASGRALAELGPAVVDPVRLAEPRPERTGGEGRGEVVRVDRFGNLLTNLPGAWLVASVSAWIGGRSVPLGRTYGDVTAGSLVALVGSDGRVEIAARDRSAAEVTGLGVGEPVRLLPAGPGGRTTGPAPGD